MNGRASGLQFMPVISSLTPVTTVLPLIFVLLVSGLKDLVDDYVSSFFRVTILIVCALRRETTDEKIALAQQYVR